jgi:hypothetical protein
MNHINYQLQYAKYTTANPFLVDSPIAIVYTTYEKPIREIFLAYIYTSLLYCMNYLTEYESYYMQLLA